MNKFGVVLGVAVAVTLAGCKDPDYRRGSSDSVQTEVKSAETVVAPVPAAKPVDVAPAVRHCTCKPGAKHSQPCACGADDCMCIVEVKSEKPAAPATTPYVVKNGDSLSKISKRFNVTISSIRRLNSLKGDKLLIGQKLLLPGAIAVVDEVAPSAAPAKSAKKPSVRKSASSYTGATKEYVVKNGDTLGGIAYGNGINIRQLKALNNLSKDTLHVGQKLKIPADAKAAKKSAKPAAAAPVAPAKAESAVTEPVAPAADAAPVAPEKAEAAPAAADSAVAPAAEAAPAAEPAAAEPATASYVVQEGDDITGVAIKWGISSADIRELNNLGDKDQLTVGQVIRLPASAQQQ